MQVWNSRFRFFWLLAILACLWISSDRSFGQVRIAREALVDSTDVDDIIGVGMQLEEQRRWGEALTHYEEALRRHPGMANLVERHLVARLHYDVGRRYSDTSYVNVVSQLNVQQSLDLYAEILLKIQEYYVEPPNWYELAQRGASAVEIALDEPRFRERHELVISDREKAAFASQVGQLLHDRRIQSRHGLRSIVGQIAYTAERTLRLPSSAVILEYASAAASSLDDYSAFLTGSQLDEVLSQIEGNFVGLGIELKAQGTALLIVNVIPGGPADRGGIQKGDRIIRVNGQPTAETTTDVAADMLKGPEGSRVELSVQNAENKQRYVSLTRTRVEVPSVDKIQMLDPKAGIAYLQLSSFQKKTSRAVEAALWDLHRQGMRSLIIDVRGNPGGLLTSAVEIADKFISEGAIVSTRGRGAGEDRDYRAHLVGTWRVPLVMLIDGDSASASEIFAGAIRDHRRGVIVGHRSFGKGSVQGIFPLEVANIGVRLTTAKFFSPHGTPISRQGVPPDVMVRITARVGDNGLPVVEQQSDPILNAGIQVARQQLSRR